MLLESSIMLLESSIMLLESSIMLLGLSITLLESIYSAGITHDDCHMTRNMFKVQATWVTSKTFVWQTFYLIL